MDQKQFILTEIRRLAAANEGNPPGQTRFHSETGMQEHEWRGKYWARWGDALREAGYSQNEWQGAYETEFLISKFIELTRELGHLPVKTELLLNANVDDKFPSYAPFKRLGGQAATISKVRDYCATHTGYDDVLAFCDARASKTPFVKGATPKTKKNDGFVYLLKSGRYYKIGRTNHLGRRSYELAIQLPEKARTIHTICTDDPIGIEAYWHNRFESKRKNGEWFDLDNKDVEAFKRRKFM